MDQKKKVKIFRMSLRSFCLIHSQKAQGSSSTFFAFILLAISTSYCSFTLVVCHDAGIGHILLHTRAG